MATPPINTEDPIFTRIRMRGDARDSKQDFDLYRREKAKYSWGTVGDAARAFSFLPPVSEGMSEAQRNALIKQYTEMLTKLEEVESQMKSEDMKTARGYQTAMSNLSSALLKYAASEDATLGGTLEAAMAAATERGRGLATEQDMYGTATLHDKVQTEYAPTFHELEGTLNPKTHEINDPAAYGRILTDRLSKITDDREIIPFLSAAAAQMGVSAEEYAKNTDSLFPSSKADAATYRSAVTRGRAALAIASEKQADLTKRIQENDAVFDQRAGGRAGWVGPALKQAMRGIAGIDTAPSPELAAALGLTSEELASGSVPMLGPDGKPVPSGSSLATGSKKDPYTADTRSRILAEIEALRAGSSPRHVQIKKAMLASDAFQTYKAKHGYTDNEVAFQAWAETAMHHARQAAKDTRIARDREILSGREEVGGLQQAGARVRTALRDMFSPKDKSSDKLAEIAAGEPGEEPKEDSLLAMPTAAVDQTSDAKKAPVATDATKKEAPASEVENPSAGITKGSAPSVSETEVGGDSKAETGKASAKYRIVNDPRNSDFIYRQYEDGRVELVGTPNDGTVSPKNPRAVTGTKAKAAITGMIGEYVAPKTDDQKLSESTREGLDLGDSQISRKELAKKTSAEPDEDETGIVERKLGRKTDDRGRTLESEEAKAIDEGVALKAEVGEAQRLITSKDGKTAMGASGPNLKLGGYSDSYELTGAVKKPEVEPTIKETSKGSLSSAEKKEALAGAPDVDRAKLTRPLDMTIKKDIEQVQPVSTMDKGALSLGDEDAAAKLRREKLRAALNEE